MIDRAIAFGTPAGVRRLGWLLLIALPIVLAACGNSGTGGY
jgi:hypothetical protein